MSAADGHAAAFFCQSVAHLLAPPGAEDDAVRHLRAEDLPDLLTHLRERLAQARAEGEAAGYLRAINDVCRFLDDEQMLAWSTSCGPHWDWFANGIQHAMFGVRKLAPAAGGAQ